MMEDYYQRMKEKYGERVDTPKPCSTGDSVEVSQLSGVPSWAADYPVEGEVIRVEPRGVGTHNILADWFVSIRFEEDEQTGVHGATSELFCVGGTRRNWDEIPVTVTN